MARGVSRPSMAASVVGVVVKIILVILLALLGLFVQAVCWNHVAPVFGAPSLTFLQVLCGNVVIGSLAGCAGTAFLRSVKK
jgi:hypothetical protein